MLFSRSALVAELCSRIHSNFALTNFSVNDHHRLESNTTLALCVTVTEYCKFNFFLIIIIVDPILRQKKKKTQALLE